MQGQGKSAGKGWIKAIKMTWKGVLGAAGIHCSSSRTAGIHCWQIKKGLCSLRAKGPARSRCVDAYPGQRCVGGAGGDAVAEGIRCRPDMHPGVMPCEVRQ
jgi:hypothetical protein